MMMCMCFGILIWLSYSPFWLRISICKACVCSSSYSFHRIHLKYFWLTCNDMTISMCFWIFDSVIFDELTALLDNFPFARLVSPTPTFFVKFIWNSADFFGMIRRCACAFWLLILLFLWMGCNFMTYRYVEWRVAGGLLYLFLTNWIWGIPILAHESKYHDTAGG